MRRLLQQSHEASLLRDSLSAYPDTKLYRLIREPIYSLFSREECFRSLLFVENNYYLCHGHVAQSYYRHSFVTNITE